MLIRTLFVCLILAFIFAPPATAQYDTNAAWPLCGNYYLTAPSNWDPAATGCPSNRWGMPDLINDTFGPRLLDGAYDWHRGLDLHTDLADGRPVFAITCGKARKVENQYNGEVIIEHYPGHVCQDADTLDDFPKCHDIGGCYYSRYQHLSSAVVVDETLVKKGELIGYSGRNTSSPTADDWDDKYPHVHFEIRDYPGGLDYYARGQREVIHPLAVLPYTDAGDGGMTLTITQVDTSSSAKTAVDVALSLPNDGEELDLVRVDISMEINGQNAPWVNPGAAYPTPDGDTYALDPPFFDMEQRSRQYNYTDTTKVPFEEFLDAANHPNGVDGQWLSPYADPASSYHQTAFPTVYNDATADWHLEAQASSNVKTGDFNGIEVSPDDFNRNSAFYDLHLRFKELPGVPPGIWLNICVKAWATDALGNTTNPDDAQWGNCGGSAF